MRRMHQFAEYPPEKRREKRQTELKSLLEEFFTWTEGIQAVGGSKLPKAIGYMTSEKKYLVCFLGSPDVPIDNNRTENTHPAFLGWPEKLAILCFCQRSSGQCNPLLPRGHSLCQRAQHGRISEPSVSSFKSPALCLCPGNRHN